MSYKFEMSELQKGMYFECRAENSTDYNIMLTLQVKDMDIEILENAVNFLIAEQAALRCCVNETEEEIYMNVCTENTINIPVKLCNNEVEAEKIAYNTFLKEFNLSKAPLIRMRYIKVKNKCNYLLICLHHLIADGTSMGIFTDRVFEIYQSMIDNKSFEMKNDKSFIEFIEDENSKLKQGLYDTQGEFWKEKLSNSTVPEFIKDYSSSGRKNLHGNEIRVEIPKNIIKKVENMAMNLEVSEYMFQMAVYFASIMRLTRSMNFGVASPFTYRPEAKYEENIGFYIYNNPIICKSKVSDSFRDLVDKVSEEIFEGYINIGYPNNLMLRNSTGNSVTGSTMFDYTFIYDVYENLDYDFFVDVKDWNFSVFPGELAVIYQKINESGLLRIQYRGENFSQESIELFGKRIVRIMEQVCENPDIIISDIDIFLKNERNALLDIGKESSFFPFKPEVIIDLFEEKVKKRRNEIAIVHDSGELTYGEINEKANAIAMALIDSNKKQDNIKTAAILMNRSVNMVASVLGVLKAGWAYVPMDLSYTKDRIKYIEKDASLSAIIITKEIDLDPAEFPNLNVVYADETIENSGRLEDPIIKRHAEDAAYIEYTSGTTGDPKGVIIDNYNIVNTVKDLERRFPLKKEDVYLFKTALTFDICGTEIYGWIVGDGKLCIPKENTEKDTFEIVAAIEKFNITHINFVPSMLKIFVECLTDKRMLERINSLKWIFTGGEAINNDLIEEFLALDTNIKLENVYGPTEATMWASHYPLRKTEKTLNVPIGKPLNEYRFYVVDKNMNLLPPMIPGELCISGAGVARGYLNKDKLTKEVFLENPFIRKEDKYWYSKLYKTGDLGRMLPDGNYEFLGRIDTQVKVNGIRIELGEIETVFSRFDGITQTACILSDGRKGYVSIILFYTGDKEIDQQELHAYASENLLSSMLPSAYYHIEELPRTLSEKVDRKKLLEYISVENKGKSTYVSPENKLEKIISKVWQDVLGVNNVSTDDNFFEIGGHSIALVRVHNTLCNRLGFTFPISILLNNPTIKGIATNLKETNKKKIDKLNKETCKKNNKSSNKSNNKSSDIAIVGISLNVPGAQNHHDFWENLKQGKDCIYEYTDEELRDLGVDENSINNPYYIKRKGRLEGIDEFDSDFFGITPAEVNMMSPQLRILYKGVWELLEDAGIAHGRLNDKTGVYIGGSDDFMWYQGKMFENENYADTYQIYTQSTNHFLATRLSHMFDFKGPSMSVLTGCSTSLLTVHLACKDLMYGECDVALAGGITIEMPNEGGYLYEPNLMLSKNGKCRPFDDKADGTVFSNGMGLVALKRLECAKKAKDHIYAIIKGSAVRNDGSEKLSYTAPSSKGQAETIKKAYKNAGISPETITYVEAHGTGTRLGDPIEITSLNEAFQTNEKQFCTVGSVKGNIGHTDTAAGILGLIKTALSLDKKYIPATINHETPNQNIDFKNSPFIVKGYGSKWERKEENIPRRAGVNAFGVGGTNVHLILEENEEESLAKQQKYNIFPISAKSKTSLSRMMKEISSYISKNNVPSSEAAWSLASGRKHFSHRGYFINMYNEKIVSSIKDKESNAEKVYFMFTGQGSQYQGMTRDLYLNEDQNPLSTIFRKNVDKILEMMPETDRKKIIEILYSNENAELINETKYSQIVLFLTQYSIACTLMKLGIKPDALVGHSIGEVIAASLAGVWTLEDSIKIVCKRAELMQEQKSGSMLAVLSDKEEIEKYMKAISNIWISVCNTTGNYVLSGENKKIDELEQLLKGDEVAYIRLKTSHAFHTPMMEKAAEEFAEFLEGIEMQEAKFDIVSNITGDYIDREKVSNPDYWAKQIVSTVNFEGILDNILEDDNSVFIEMGGSTLCSLANSHVLSKPGHSFISTIRHPNDNQNDLVYLLKAIGEVWNEGIGIRWDVLYPQEDRKRIYLPKYSFDKISYPIQLDINHEKGRKAEIKEKQIVKEVSKSSLSESSSVNSGGILKVVRNAFVEVFEIEDINNESDFFEVGGDSMQAASLASKLRKYLEVPVTVGEIFENTTPLKLADTLRTKKFATVRNIKRIPKAVECEHYPLTPAQKRMYMLNALDKENLAFNLPSATLIEGKLEVDKVKIAINRLIERHEILRTTFKWKNNEIVQVINKDFEVPLSITKINGDFDIDALVKDFIKPFELDKAPLLRVKLIENEHKHLILFDVHHIIADGTSVELLTRDFNELYSGDLPALNLQYKDYSIWLQDYLNSEEVARQEEYWLDNLSGKLPILELPTDYERPSVRQFEGDRYLFSLGKDMTKALTSKSKELGVTNYMIALSAWFIVLSKYANQTDIIVGTPVSGRNMTDIEECLGMFVNMLPIRGFPEGEKRYIEFLGEIKESVLGSLDNQDYQFDTLVERLNISRRLDRNAIYDVSFDYHNIKKYDLEIDGLKSSQEELITGKVANELILTCNEDKDENITCFIDYSISLYKETSIKEFAISFINILNLIINDPDTKLKDITSSKVNKFLGTDKIVWGPHRGYDYSLSVGDLFDKWVQSDPNKVAIINSEGNEFTYNDISEKVENLLAALIKNGACKNDSIAIIPRRNETMIIAMLAILKAGANYVLIDNSYPDQRINNIILKSKAKFVLCYKEEMHRVGGNHNLLDLEALSNTKHNYISSELFEYDPESLAYILFTSGSSGSPKGVGVTQKNLLNFIYDTQERGLIGQDNDRVCCITTPSFDIFGYESIVPLCSGSSIYIANDMEQLDAKLLSGKITKYQVTHLLSAVSKLRALVENVEFLPALKILKHIMGGGEHYPISLMEFLQENTNAKLYNLYGPTETTIWSTVKELTNSKKINIGKAITNTQLFVIDKDGKILPREVYGELCIAGDGVSRGYIGMEEETNTQFVKLDEFGGGRVYRTGDKACILENGEVQLAGRMDSQVKLHGYRIELEEIEKIVQNSGLVEDAAVIVKRNENGNDQLCMFYSKSGEDISLKLKNYISSKLPAYMIPDIITKIKKLPITINGKVDRKSLEQLELKDLASNEQINKESIRMTSTKDIEDEILDIWKSVLNNDDITSNDNFFDVGGNSYSLMLVSNKIGELLGESIELTQLFEYPTVSSLVESLNIQLEDESLEESRKEKISREIAVVGMAGKFPGASNINEFWENIIEGKESIEYFTDEELLESGIEKSEINNSNYVKAKGYLKDAEYFDSKFFNMSKREVETMDPQIRLLMQCCWNALEDANCNPYQYPGDIALFAGSSSNVLWLSQLAGKGNDIMEAFSAMTVNDKDFLTTQISYKLNLKGPSVNVQTACSTSLVAINQAAKCLLAGEADIAMAGGVSLTYPRKEGYMWHEDMIYSEDGHCRPFSKDATGTVLGNGCGVVVLKMLDDAKRDGDEIYAILSGTAINNDGMEKVGYSAPSVKGQRKVIEETIKDANIDPKSIGYVEAHGTGTKLGDPVEIEALKQAWNVREKGFCSIGSIKANIGHLDAAAGVAGFIKAVCVLKNRVIPPLVNYTSGNPAIKIKDTPFYISKEVGELKEKYTSVAVSSFGIGGTNAHVILSEPPKREETIKNNDVGLLLFSAKTEESLRATTEAVTSQMKKDNLSVSDVAYTLCLGRPEFPVRLSMVLTGDEKYDKNQLEKIKDIPVTHIKSAGTVKTVCCFSDDIEEIFDLGRNLMNQRAQHIIVSRFRRIMGEIIDSVDRGSAQTIEKVLIEEKLNISEDELLTVSSAISIAIYKLLESYNMKANLLTYKGFGIIPAVVVTKRFSLYEALQLYKKGNLDNLRDITHSTEKNIEIIDNKDIDLTDFEGAVITVGCGTNGVICEKADTNIQVSLLKAIGELWCNGSNLNRHHLNSGELKHVHGYVFEKEKHPADINLKLIFNNPTNNVVPINDSVLDSKAEIIKEIRSIWEEIFGEENILVGENFFELGGDSLNAIRMAALIKQKLGVKVPQSILYEKATIEQISEWIFEESKVNIEKVQKTEDLSGIRALNEQEFYETSDSQKRLYTMQKIYPKSVAYNLASAYIIEGELNRKKIENVFNELIQRHEAFRTSFGVRNDEIVQYISKSVANPFVYEKRDGIDIKGLLEDFIEEFDLSQAPLMRVKLVSISEEEHYLLLDMHHIIADQSSIDILMKEFYQLYNGQELEPLSIQFKEFAAWQNKYMETEDAKKQLDYWVKEFEGEIKSLDLHRDYAVPSNRNYNGRKMEFKFSKEQSEALTFYSSQNNVTPYMTMFLAVQLLLWKYTQQTYSTIGTAVEGRSNPELNNIVGTFVNILAINGEIYEEKTIRQQLQLTKEKMIEAFEHQDCQYNTLVEELRNSAGINEELFDIVINYVRKGTQEFSIEGLNMIPYEEDDIQVKFDLMFVLVKSDNAYSLDIEYATELYSDDTIKQLGNRFLIILESIINDSDCLLKEFTIPLTEDENRLYKSISNRISAPQKNQSIAEIFESVVDDEGERPAIIYDDIVINYQQLNNMANILANRLIKLGIKKNERVSLILDPGPLQIITIIAILKCGACYVPIESNYPKERIKYILNDSNSAIVLVEKPYVEKCGEEIKKIIINENDIMSQTTNALNVELLEREDLSIDDEAYIMYTSGSTGNPKGTLINERSILRIAVNGNYLKVKPGDPILQMASYAFDASIFEIFAPLLSGGHCVIVPKAVAMDITKLTSIIEKYNMAAIFVTTSLFNLIVDHSVESLKNAKKIFVGGEELSIKHMKKALKAVGEGCLHNIYGPTETTVFATYYPLNEIPENSVSIPIGYAITDTSLYVLDDQNRLLPPGIPGELCIGGSGLAQGYINNEKLTNECFIKLPFGNRERIYKTGDRVLLDNKGRIIYLGRNDSQVKINGFRIELSDVKKHIDAINGIKKSVVLVLKDYSGLQCMAAYYTINSKDDRHITPSFIRKHLEQLIPPYMIPSKIMKLDDIPLNANKKTDYRKLREMGTQIKDNPTRSQKRLEDNSVNYVLEVMKEILNNYDINEDDSFFLSGGTSIKAITISQRFREEGYEVSVSEILSSSSIGELAKLDTFNDFNKENNTSQMYEKNELYALNIAEIQAYVDYTVTSSDIITTKIKNNKIVREFPMSPIQELHLKTDNRLSGMSVSIKTDKGDMEVCAALAEEICKHQILHSTADFKRKTWSERKINITPETLAQYLTIIDISKYESNTKRKIIELIQKEILSVERNSEELMWKLCCIKEEQNKYLIIWSFDHICFDGMSAEIIKDSLLYKLSFDKNKNTNDKYKYAQKYSDYVKNTIYNGEKKLPQYLERGFEKWKELNNNLALCIKKDVGEIQKISMKLDLTRAGQDVFGYTILQISKLLETYTQMKEIPVMLLSYGRTFKQKDYYNCVGEFLDLIPITLNKETLINDIQKNISMIQEKGINFISTLKSMDEIDVLLDSESDKNKGDFILINFQGFILEGEQTAFKKATESKETGELANWVIVANFNDTGIYIDMENSYGFNKKKLIKSALSLDFQVESYI